MALEPVSPDPSSNLVCSGVSGRKSPLVNPFAPNKSEFIPPIRRQPLARQSRAPLRPPRHPCGSNAWRSKPRPRTRSWERTHPHPSGHGCVCSPCRCVCPSSAGTLPSRGASDTCVGACSLPRVQLALSSAQPNHLSDGCGDLIRSLQRPLLFQGIRPKRKTGLCLFFGMCVCMCQCVHVVYICLCVHVCEYMSLYVCACVFICVYMCMSVSLCAFVSVYVFL